ncbi:hypothetical protein [Desulfobacula sp.]|uniref:hypothetical protein n=1 Tax=Desulfobacula sp. TaxID=2593537 RepID=UPI0025C33115|nr:hypothetical protein [Desulfobacula sp.]MBC2704882.1 hypothetical protein [Desulfobacula sp.]
MSAEWTDEKRKEMLASFFKTAKSEFNRCLEFSMTCENKTIRAHSIQNSRILDNLVVDGHVTMFNLRIDKEKGAQVDYALVGRNNATTFSGLCSDHDNTIFKPIDDEAIDLKNKQHLFLLAYRAVHRELHATMDAAVKIQSSYIKKTELGLDPKDVPSEAGMIAVQKMMISWETYRYKTDFDMAYIKKDFDKICHNTFVFELENPTIAVCALFSVDNHVANDDALRIALNILPISQTQTFVVISYRDVDSLHARAALDRVLTSNGFHQRYELSRFILNNCENFVMSPTYVDSWTDEKKKEERKIERIKIIRIDDEGRLHLHPEEMEFNHIYRSAAEVHWNEETKSLYSPKPCEWTYIDWIRQILGAVRAEYGIELVIDENTSWENIRLISNSMKEN